MLSKYLKQAVDSIGEGTLRSYSGRGMYGQECIGLVVDSISDYTTIIIQATLFAELDEKGDLFSFEARTVGMDNMGKGWVFYWPSKQFKENEGDDDESNN